LRARQSHVATDEMGLQARLRESLVATPARTEARPPRHFLKSSYAIDFVGTVQSHGRERLIIDCKVPGNRVRQSETSK
jgi:hypothetical protein